MVHVDPAHQARMDSILRLKEGGLNCRQIAAYLNDEGVSSWAGKRFCPELVFGILRKARLKNERLVDAGAVPEIRVAIERLK